jgi:hypothetical protein
MQNLNGQFMLMRLAEHCSAVPLVVFLPVANVDVHFNSADYIRRLVPGEVGTVQPLNSLIYTSCHPGYFNL